jgi:hypothetical protein
VRHNERESWIKQKISVEELYMMETFILVFDFRFLYIWGLFSLKKVGQSFFEILHKKIRTRKKDTKNEEQQQEECTHSKE